jgi:hypothetical protein
MAANKFVKEKIILYRPYSVGPTHLKKRTTAINPTTPGINLDKA